MAWFPLNLRCSAPIIMVSTLLAALASVIGHHFFYHRLNGQPVLDSDPLSSIASFYSISDQQFNVSIGTLFALLVKSLLGIAVSTVFDQFAWKAIKGRTRSIGVIDDLFSALKNGFMVLDYALWRHYPLNMLLACIAWLLPVATVITPATLSVHMASFSNTTLMRVPRVDFRTFKFASLKDYANTPQFIYETSKPEVQRILMNTAVQGNIMPIKPPSINSSWALDFYGPALRCENVDDDAHRAITQNVQSAILDISSFDLDDRKDLARLAFTFGYLAWPASTSNTDKTLPFGKSPENSTYSLRINKDNPVGTDDGQNTDPTSIFIATFPHMAEQGDRTERELNYTSYCDTRPNYTDSPMPDVNVTMTTYRNIYSYSQRILWTAYGIALGVSVLSVLLGVLIYFFNHGSYSTKFSTILRTTRTAEISTVLNAEDIKGLDPLPDHITDASISFKDEQDQGRSPGKAVFNVEELDVPLTPQTPESVRLLKSPELYEEVGLGLNQRLGPSGWFNDGARRNIMYHEVNQ